MAISNSSRGLTPGICTSTSRPANPYEGQMIYETDTDLMYVYNGSAFVEIASTLTKAPRGVIGQVQRTSGDISIAGAAQDITGMSITFSAVAGRAYKASWLVTGNKNATDRDGTEVIFTNSANTVIARVPLITMGGTNIGLNFSSSVFFTSTAGSVTFKLRALSFSGTLIVNASAYAPCFFMIEDVGIA